MSDTTDLQILDQAVVDVPIKDLKTYRKNPRKGDIGAVAESLKANGQFRPIIVQKSTMEILGGNHTMLAAKSLKWKTIKAVFVDVDDKAAAKIVLADNRTSDLATYDSDVLSEILDSIEMPHIGTGYNQDDVKSILAAVEEQNAEMLSESLYKPPAITFRDRDEDEDEYDFDDSIEDAKRRAKNMTGEDTSVEEAIAAQQNVSSEDRAMADLQVTLEFIQEEGFRDKFKSSNYWGIPDLLKNRLVEEIPEKIDTWAGKDVTEDDGETTWIYNYGVTSPTGIPWDRTLLSFFTYDTKFHSWLENPAYQIAKYFTKGVTQSIVPDTSFWLNDPRFQHLLAVNDSMFVGRMMQEAGMRVMPRLMWCDMESIKYGILGIPVGAPVVSVCIQAINDKEMEAAQTDLGLREFVKAVKPEALLVYSGNPGKRAVERAKLPSDLHVVMVDNFAAKRRGVAFDKADGKEAVEAADKKVARAQKKVAKKTAATKKAAPKSAESE